MRNLSMLLCGLVVFIAGCNAPPPDQVRKTGATLLYDVLIEIDPATAKKDAQFISTAMSTDIIPFVTDSKLPAAQLIPQLRKLLGAKLANQKYVGTALSIVSMATSFGNINIKAPKMSDTERAYVLAACGAIQDACDGFLTGKSVRVQLFKPTEGESNACVYDDHNIDADCFVSPEQCGGVGGGGKWRESLRRTAYRGPSFGTDSVSYCSGKGQHSFSVDSLNR